jgi:hypothetical protein
MKFLLFVLLGSSCFAQPAMPNSVFAGMLYQVMHPASTSVLNADAYLNMAGQSVGTALTTTIMTNGTVGSIGHWTKNGTLTSIFLVAAKQTFTLHTPVKVGGTSYSGSTSLSMSYLHTSGTKTMELDLNATKANVTVAGFITFGPALTSNGLFDYVALYGGINPWYAVIQLETDGATDYNLNIETNPAGVTTHSSNIAITSGSTYCCSMNVDTVGGTATLKAYEISGWTLVGSVTGTMGTSDPITYIRLGNNEVGTSSGHTSYMQDWCVDFSNHLNPLGP